MEQQSDISSVYEALKRLTLDIITECQAREFFSKLDEKTFQLSLFDEGVTIVSDDD